MSAHIIAAYGPNDALESGLHWLKVSGVVNQSRNGRVVQAPGPVITRFGMPAERVMFSSLRDANPFFHLYECLWMLAGRNDVESVARFAKQMSNFSDDGEYLWGAYGFRWRHFFGFDQLLEIIDMLQKDPLTRRAVLTMWAPNGDLIMADGGVGGSSAKDVPCNTQVYFDLTRGVLDMTVCNRSNDIVWGAYGANVVHMSFLQEFVASAVRAPLGAYYQVSNNYHMYCDRDDVKRLLDATDPDQSQWSVRYRADDRYTTHGIKSEPILPDSKLHLRWLGECEIIAEHPFEQLPGALPFFADVVWPMMKAHEAYKAGDFAAAYGYCSNCAAEDWRTAAWEWIKRREQKLSLGDGVVTP